MKLYKILCGLVLVILIPTQGLSLGFEFAITAWKPSLAGEVSYDALTEADILELDDVFDLDEPWRLSGRLKLDIPFFPNLYLMATPMEFSGPGVLPFSLNFGDTTFSPGVELDAFLTLNIYDVGLYYTIPFLGIATAGILNCEVGLDARMIDLKAQIEEVSTGLDESEDFTVAFPLLYGAVQIYPVKHLALEVEARGVSYGDNRIFSLISRLKIRPIGPVFIAGGYRDETILFDYKGIEMDMRCTGPFAEAGLQW